MSLLTSAIDPQLPQLRGTERTFTLLHALVEQIMLHEPVLANFTKELGEFETVPGGISVFMFDQRWEKIKLNETNFSMCVLASVKGLTAEVDGE